MGTSLLQLSLHGNSDWGRSVIAQMCEDWDIQQPIESSVGGLEDICRQLDGLCLPSNISEQCGPNSVVPPSHSSELQAFQQPQTHDIYLEPPRLPDTSFDIFEDFHLDLEVSDQQPLLPVPPQRNTAAQIDRDLRRQAIYLPSTSSLQRSSHIEYQFPGSTIPPQRPRTYRPADARSSDPPPPYSYHEPPRIRFSRFTRRRANRSDWRPKLHQRTGHPYTHPFRFSRTLHRGNKGISSVEREVGAVGKMVKELPKVVHTAQKSWRIKRAKHKLAWLEKHQFLSGQERLLVAEIRV